MFEHQCFPQGGGDCENAPQNSMHLQNMAADKILEKLADLLEDADEKSFSPEAMDSYLSLLEKQKPLTSEFDVEHSLAKFHEKHAVLFQDVNSAKEQPTLSVVKRPKTLRRARLVAAIAAILIGCLGIAHAIGVNFFGTIAHWTDETFTFQTEPSSPSPDVDTKANIIKIECSSLEDAVVTAGIPAATPLVPKWIPDGFQLQHVTVCPLGHATKVEAYYEANSISFTIDIWGYDSYDTMQSNILEKDSSKIVLYESGGIQHYIMSNNATYTAAWINGTSVCSIFGDLTEGELEKLIDSIYEG